MVVNKVFENELRDKDKDYFVYKYSYIYDEKLSPLPKSKSVVPKLRIEEDPNRAPSSLYYIIFVGRLIFREVLRIRNNYFQHCKPVHKFCNDSRLKKKV